MKLRHLLACVLVGCVALGCGDGGPKRYRLSGKATFDGQPIVYGDVLFTPDASKGNQGPQGIANIRDGQFDTSASGGQGIAGGPTVIRVTGFTGEGGKLICEYEWSVDLPRADGTHEIEVPKKGAAGPGAKPPGEI